MTKSLWKTGVNIWNRKLFFSPNSQFAGFSGHFKKCQRLILNGKFNYASLDSEELASVWWFIFATGTTKFHDCPANPNIPVYLIIGGTASIITQLLTFVDKMSRGSSIQLYGHQLDYKSIDDHNKCTSSIVGGCISLINSFMTIWFIVGKAFSCSFLYVSQ